MDELPGVGFSSVGVVAEAMIEQGLVMLIQAGIGSPPMAVGGFAGQLPTNLLGSPAYVYSVISDRPNTTLRGTRGFGNRIMEFKCYGPSALLAQQLANAVDNVLDGYQGTLPDPDSTVVNSIIRTDRMGPDFSDSARNFYITLEYSIWFYSP